MKRIDYIQPAKASDLPQILTLLQLVHLPIEGVAEHVSDFIQIKVSDRTSRPILGCVGLEIYGCSALLRSLAVKPEHQGKGYATAAQKLDNLGHFRVGAQIARTRHFFEADSTHSSPKEYDPSAVSGRTKTPVSNFVQLTMNGLALGSGHLPR